MEGHQILQGLIGRNALCCQGRSDQVADQIQTLSSPESAGYGQGLTVICSEQQEGTLLDILIEGNDIIAIPVAVRSKLLFGGLVLSKAESVCCIQSHLCAVDRHSLVSQGSMAHSGTRGKRQLGDGISLKGVAVRTLANTLLFTGSGVGSRGDFLPLVPVVVEGGNIFYVLRLLDKGRVGEGRRVGGSARRGAGGGGGHFTSGIDRLCFNIIRSGAAFTLTSADGCAGAVVIGPGVGHRAPIVAEGIDRPGLNRIAAGAGAGLHASFRAGRRSGHRPIAIIMVEGIGIGVSIAVLTARTGMGGIALLGTGRFGDYRCVVMTKGRGIFRVCIVAARAGVGLDACFRAGGAVNGRVVMAEGIHRTGLDRITAGASAGLLAIFRAGGFGSHFPLAKAVDKGGSGPRSIDWVFTIGIAELLVAEGTLPILIGTSFRTGSRNSIFPFYGMVAGGGDKQTFTGNLLCAFCVRTALAACNAKIICFTATFAAGGFNSCLIYYWSVMERDIVGRCIGRIPGDSSNFRRPASKSVVGTRVVILSGCTGDHDFIRWRAVVVGRTRHSDAIIIYEGDSELVHSKGGRDGHIGSGHGELVVRDLNILIVPILHRKGFQMVAISGRDRYCDFLTFRCLVLRVRFHRPAGNSRIDADRILALRKRGHGQQRKHHGQCHNQCDKPFCAHFVLPSASKSYLPIFGIYSLPARIRHPMRIVRAP